MEFQYATMEKNIKSPTEHFWSNNDEFMVVFAEEPSLDTRLIIEWLDWWQSERRQAKYYVDALTRSFAIVEPDKARFIQWFRWFSMVNLTSELWNFVFYPHPDHWIDCRISLWECKICREFQQIFVSDESSLCNRSQESILSIYSNDWFNLPASPAAFSSFLLSQNVPSVTRNFKNVLTFVRTRWHFFTHQTWNNINGFLFKMNNANINFVFHVS